MFKRFVTHVGVTAALCSAALALQLSGQAQVLNGAGATFPYPIYAKWFAAYTQAHPNVKFNYQPVGSGAGISQYKAGTVDFGASDAPLTDAEFASMPQPTVLVPAVAGSIVPAYNVPGIASGLRFSGPVIAGIYLGQIRQWNDPQIVRLNPGKRLPNMPIAVAHRSDGSGTTFIFTHYLAAVSPEWSTKVGSGKAVSWPVGQGGNGNAGVAGLIHAEPGGFGYLELAYAITNHIAYGPVQNRSGRFIDASVQSTAAAAAAGVAAMQHDVRVSVVNGTNRAGYPIVGFTYLMMPKMFKDHAKAVAMLSYLKWAWGPGASMANELYYAPLPAKVVSLNMKLLAGVH